MNQKQFLVSAAPHIKTAEDIPRIMYAVIIALVPAVIASVYFFGFLAVKLIAVCVISAMLTEYVFQKLRKKKVSIFDGSAIITGLLLALTLPPTLPIFAAVVGTVFAVGLGKQIFGGLGYNIFNPALLGRAFLMAAFPALMTSWINPFSLDALTQATPLAQMKFSQVLVSHQSLFLGNVSGSLGEASALALLLGAGFLLIRKIIDWRIPAGYLGVVVLWSGVFWLFNSKEFADPIWHLLSGGLLLGAFFMATDMVTTPVTRQGKWIFGIGCGILLMLIRFWGGLPEGVMYSILLMNALTPLINRFIRPRIFGELEKNNV